MGAGPETCACSLLGPRAKGDCGSAKRIQGPEISHRRYCPHTINDSDSQRLEHLLTYRVASDTDMALIWHHNLRENPNLAAVFRTQS